MGLGTSLVIAAPIITVISCGPDFGENYEYFGDIEVITDAGSVSDKSFNESAFDAVKDYSQLVNKNKTFGYLQPKSDTTALLNKAYLTALRKGSRTLILPGFIHTDGDGGNAIKFASKYHKKYPKAKYICLDGFASDKIFGVKDGKDPKTGEDNYKYGSGEKFANSKGFFNISFDTTESGFMAAVNAGAYMNENGKVRGNELKMQTFGGMAIAYGVTNFMDGFIQGAKWFNDKLKTSQEKSKT